MSNLNRNHRTAVFVDVSDANPEFRERATRLVDSLNRTSGGSGYGIGTIKADVFSVDANGKITAGLVFGATDPATSDEDLTDLARENGYSQAVIVRNTSE